MEASNIQHFCSAKLFPGHKEPCCRSGPEVCSFPISAYALKHLGRHLPFQRVPLSSYGFGGMAASGSNASRAQRGRIRKFQSNWEASKQRTIVWSTIFLAPSLSLLCSLSLSLSLSLLLPSLPLSSFLSALFLYVCLMSSLFIHFVFLQYLEAPRKLSVSRKSKAPQRCAHPGSVHNKEIPSKLPLASL